MHELDSDLINKIFKYKEFLPFLHDAFSNQNIVVPKRKHYSLPGKNTSLVMPAWNDDYYGIKQILISPDNPAVGLPTIRGDYNLYNVINGDHLIRIDAPKLTAIRTAATSVLAASIIRDKPTSLYIIGAGVIAEELISAYSAIFDIQKIKIWNRTTETAQKLVEKYKDLFPVSLSTDLEKDINDFDVISCATHASEPIIKGNWIYGSHHFDLIGSYTPNMREVDDDLIQKSDIYIDHEGALTESGDLAIPLESGTIKLDGIRGNLFQLCNGQKSPDNKNGITLFKSVGHALEDLAGAIYLYQKLIKK